MPLSARDLRLDLEAAARSSAIVAEPSGQPLMERLLSQDPDDIMPPPEEGARFRPRQSIFLRVGLNRSFL